MSFRGMETSMQDGVFYQIVSSGLKTVCEDEFWEQKDTIAVIDAHKLENSQSFGQFCCGCSGGEYIRGCRVIQDKSHTLIEWHVPEKTKKNVSWHFAVFITAEKIVCIQYTGSAGKVQELINTFLHKEAYTKERFLYELFGAMTADDLQYMEKLERTLSVLEEEVFRAGGMDFNSSMLQVKRKFFSFTVITASSLKSQLRWKKMKMLFWMHNTRLILQESKKKHSGLPQKHRCLGSMRCRCRRFISRNWESARITL